jgi:hypothetical protein
MTDHPDPLIDPPSGIKLTATVSLDHPDAHVLTLRVNDLIVGIAANLQQLARFAGVYRLRLDGSILTPTAAQTPTDDRIKRLCQFLRNPKINV